jgi:hypothetical protein
VARTSNVIWTVVVVLLLLFGLVAAVFGPRLYREGKALLGPIAELATSEKAMKALDEEFPFQPPDDGIVDEGRFLVFLGVWGELQPAYARWQDLVGELEGRRTQSWQEAKDALAATRDVHRAQHEALRAHGMSPTELVWIEDAALAWWRQVEPLIESEDRPAIVQHLREAREEDLRVVANLERRYGASPALEAMGRHLEERLAALDVSVAPEVDGVPEANQGLFWRYRQKIASIAGASRNPLHEMIREPGGIRIEVQDDGQPGLGQPESGG